ncbi:MAG: PAS domain S-box protein [Tahibacter sp.]
MDRRISGLVLLGFTGLLLLGLGTNVFLQQTLQERIDAARSFQTVLVGRSAIREARGDYLTIGQTTAGFLLDINAKATFDEVSRRQKQSDADADQHVERALAATKDEALKTVLRQLQEHDHAVTNPLQERILQLNVSDDEQARTLYQQQYVPAERINLDLLAHALRLANAELDELQASADAEAEHASNIAWYTILLFIISGVLAAGFLAHAVARLVRESAAGAEENRDLVENSLDVICSVDASGCFVRVSGACERIWGYTAEELKGLAYISLVHPEDVEKTNLVAAEMITGHSTRGFTNRYLRKDGGIVHMLWSARWVDAQQQIFAVAHDITERQLAVQALLASEERTRLIVATAHDAFLSMDSAGNVTDWNPQAEATFGWSREEVLGKPLHELIILPDMRESYVRRLRHFEATREGSFLNQLIEMTVLHRDGHELPIEFNVSAIPLDRSFAFCLFLRDITERERSKRLLHEAKDAAEAANRAKSEFLANMSHEIRTPMNGVLGTVDLLLSTPLSGIQRELAGLARASGETLLTIINDILDFARVEAGKLEIEPVPFDLLLAIEEVSGMIAMQAEKKNLDLIVRYPPDVPRHLTGDAGRIRQILTNLVNNAVKFTMQGNVLINVEAEARSDTDVLLRFEIEDTGIGIPENRLDHLFEKFTQADSSTTRRFGGTGLGLAICRQLAGLMGGEIGARSKEGEGSTFWFTLRLPLSLETPVTYPAIDLSGTRILIVDDNALNRRVLHEQIISWKMRNGSCSSAAEALQTLRAAHTAGDPYQIAILDYQMPDMDGEMLGAAIKADPTLCNIELVMLTSLGRRGDAAQLKEIGFAAYLVKPARQSELLDTLVHVWAAHIHQQPIDLLTNRPVWDAILAPTTAPVEHFHFNARVLLAEDNTTNQIVASMMLRTLGCEVDVVANGSQALEKLQTTDYDVVFMDCEMPEMDGFEATAAIRLRPDDKAHVAIVAVTAQAMQGDRERCLRAGMNGYLSKPVKVEDFEAQLRRWVPQRADGDEANRAGLTESMPAILTTPVRAPALNPDVFARLRELSLATDPALLQQIFDSFHDDCAKRILALRHAVEIGDAISVQKGAHALTGAAANVGAESMATISARLETTGLADSPVGTLQLIEQLQAEFVRVTLEVNAHGICVGSAPRATP